MKNGIIWTILSLFLVTGCGKNELMDFHTYPHSSSVPGASQPLTIKIPKSFQKSGTLRNLDMKVWIFPHTIKGSAHGSKLDDAKTVSFESEAAIILSTEFEKFETSEIIKVEYNGGKLDVTFGAGEIQTFEKFKIESTKPILVFRKNNPTRSHTYEGFLTISRNMKKERIDVINTLNIEKYLRGVIPSEISPKWPIESVKAQTLAARSYALYHLLTAPKERAYHVDDTARYQVYTGIDRAAKRSDNAIKQTAGQVMTNNEHVIVAFFHSYSGGFTDSALNIFKRKNNYCLGNEEIFSRDELRNVIRQSAHWIIDWTTKSYSPKSLLNKLKNVSSLKKKLKSFSARLAFTLEESEFLERSGTVKKMIMIQGEKSVTLDFSDIRKAIGWSKFFSYHYRVHTDAAGKYFFKGNGWGHHVGMSQWGAMMMAKYHGKTYREILHHYYANITIQPLPY